MNFNKFFYAQILKDDSLVGYSLIEIMRFEKANNIEFPLAYKEYLLLMGKKGRFLQGYDLLLDQIKSIRNSAEILVENNEPKLQLTSNHFVFLMNEGYLFFFFDISKGNNPPVYGFAEAANLQKIEKLSDSFTDFIENLYFEKHEFLKPLFENTRFFQI